jgi:hypothetical protein
VLATEADTFVTIARQIVNWRNKLAAGPRSRAEEYRLQQLIGAVEAVITMRACSMETELELYTELQSQLRESALAG